MDMQFKFTALLIKPGIHIAASPVLAAQLFPVTNLASPLTRRLAPFRLPLTGGFIHRLICWTLLCFFRDFEQLNSSVFANELCQYPALSRLH